MNIGLIIDGSDVAIPLPLDRCVVGRNADCDVRLPDGAVSNHHAEFICINGRCFVEDLQSTNGTYVNGRRVTRAELLNGDTINFGRKRFTVRIGPAAPGTVTPNPSRPAKPVTAGKGRSAIVRAVARSTLSDDIERAVEQLEQSVRRRRSRATELPVAILKLLGAKESDHSVRLDRPTIELCTGRRCMAFVSRRPNGYYFIPASEDAATRVNGIASRPPGRALFHRDVIDVAGVSMEFRFPETESMPANEA